MPRLDRYAFLSFDCYGTLIDFERGVLAVLRSILPRHGVRLSDDQILELYGSLKLKLELERGPFKPFREVLHLTMDSLGRQPRFSPSPSERTALADSLGA